MLCTWPGSRVAGRAGLLLDGPLHWRVVEVAGVGAPEPAVDRSRLVLPGRHSLVSFQVATSEGNTAFYVRGSLVF
jgi:hypothetical protein